MLMKTIFSKLGSILLTALFTAPLLMAQSDKPIERVLFKEGKVLFVQAGKTIEEYAQLHLWSKIGSQASWKRDPSGNPTTYANVLATCRDHARLGYLMLHGGQWAGTQVVSSSFVSRRSPVAIVTPPPQNAPRQGPTGPRRR